MMKLTAIFNTTVLVHFPTSVRAQQQEPQEKLIHEVFISTLNPYINNAVNKHFGFPKQYALYDLKIIEIRRPFEEQQYTLEVKV